MNIIKKLIRFVMGRTVILLMLFVSSFVLTESMFQFTVISAVVFSSFLLGVRLAQTSWRYRWLIIFCGIGLLLLWLTIYIYFY